MERVFTLKTALALTLLITVSSCSSTSVNAQDAPATPPAVDDTPSQTMVPEDPYELRSTNQKLVNDRGDGFEPLYGTRNLRAVVAGVMYRGGANNKYFKYGPRDNRNPLPDLGLKNLCEEGFSTAVYLYSDNYATAPKRVDCIDRRTGQANTLAYEQIGPYNERSVRDLLSMVHRKIKAPSEGSVYMHCWNGWHASGLISAYALRQFCGLTGDQAVKYWDLNTDGNHTDPNFAKIRANIRAFTPHADLAITAEERESLCLPLTALIGPL